MTSIWDFVMRVMGGDVRTRHLGEAEGVWGVGVVVMMMMMMHDDDDDA